MWLPCTRVTSCNLQFFETIYLTEYIQLLLNDELANHFVIV